MEIFITSIVIIAIGIGAAIYNRKKHKKKK